MYYIEIMIERNIKVYYLLIKRGSLKSLMVTVMKGACHTLLIQMPASHTYREVPASLPLILTIILYFVIRRDGGRVVVAVAERLYGNNTFTLLCLRLRTFLLG